MPDSRLLLKNNALSDEATRLRYKEKFAENGIAANRVELVGLAASLVEHLGTYSRLDIALDTFPYNGTTTTCEAMWMGVPVITLAGTAHAGRVGVSLLSAIGLTNHIAQDPDHYITIAAELADNKEKLSSLRSTLREKMLGSTLCDDKGFTRNVESAYRLLWREWCSRNT
jgi:predicted O-linked N-acetylglucosamine transferase (SPINDLY family)